MQKVLVLALMMSLSFALKTRDSGVTLSYYVYSDTHTSVTPTNDPTRRAVPAIVATGTWTASLPGAIWIWTDLVEVDCLFSNQFYVYGVPFSVTVDYAADFAIQVLINGKTVGCDDLNGSSTKETQQTCDITSLISYGINYIQFSVKNKYAAGGLLYRVTVVTDY
jgi:hypothetical protein